MSGSRNPMFEVDRSGGAAARRRHRPADDRPDVPPRLGRPVEQRQLGRPADVAAEDPDLVDGLRRASVAQLGRPVGGQQDERDARQRRLDDGGQQLRDGRPGRHDDGDRPARRAGETQREEPGRALVEQHADAQARVGARGERERRRPRSGADDDVGHARRRPAPGRSRGARARRSRRVLALAAERRDHRPQLEPRLVPFARRIRVGDDPAAGEQDALPRPDTSPQRSATISSPSPSAPSQPTGPAYQPRSKPSCSAMRSSATSRGSPPTAGVGWSSAASASSPASSRSVPVIGVTRCWTWRSGRIPGAPRP